MIFQLLNGDALADRFPKSIPGNRIIFRECLVDGPVSADTLAGFWSMREDFLKENYPEASQLDYPTAVRDEIVKINSIDAGDRVYCWFEEDLFCQINLWFVLNLLNNQKVEVFLVLPPADSRYHFSALSEEELEKTFRTKSHFLTPLEREALGKMWPCYQQENVEKALHLAELLKARFPFLLSAVQAWIDGFPLGDYPGKLKATLLEIHKNNPKGQFSTIFKEFQKRLPEYGLGDLQVKRMCKELGLPSRNIS